MTITPRPRTLERDGQSMSLTTGKFALLKVLVTTRGTPRHRDKLMELARGREYEVFDRSIESRCRACASSSRGSRESRLHPDRVGVRLRLRADGRQQ